MSKVSISIEIMERALEGDLKARSVAWNSTKVARIKAELFRARIEEERSIREYEADLSAPMAPEGSYVPPTGTRSPRKAKGRVRVPDTPPSPLRDPWKAPAGRQTGDVELPPYALHDPWKPMKPFSSPYDVEPELPMSEPEEPLNRPECKGWEANNWNACHMPLTRPICVPPKLTLDQPCEVWMGVVLFNPTIGETILMKACGVLETVPSVNWVFARSEREFDGCGA